MAHCRLKALKTLITTLLAWRARMLQLEVQGDTCVISGLKSRPDLNSRRGIIRGYNNSSGRFKVEFGDGAQVAVRPENLERDAQPTPAPLPGVRRAWRSFNGIFDGDSEDEDEYKTDAKRQAASSSAGEPQRAYDADVTLLPRAGPVVTVVATSDLHRHHNEKYIANDTYNLVEWFESDQSPPHVDVAMFAGDLGLEMSCESTAGPYKEFSEERILELWRETLRRMLAAKPFMHVVLVGGNHDGLLCRDNKCLACAHIRDKRGHPLNGATPSEAGRNNVNAMIEGLPGAERVHVLYDEPVDVPLARSNNEMAVRVVGSPWTSYDTQGREHLSYSHHWRPEAGGIFGGATLQLYEERMDCKAWWQDHWDRIGNLQGL